MNLKNPNKTNRKRRNPVKMNLKKTIRKKNPKKDW